MSEYEPNPVSLAVVRDEAAEAESFDAYPEARRPKTVRIGRHEFYADPIDDCYGCLGTGFIVGFGHRARTTPCHSCRDTCLTHEALCDRDEALIESAGILR